MRTKQAGGKRGGQAAAALLFWVFGLAVIFVPFLRSADSADQEWEDPVRELSEVDFPFEGDVEAWETDFEEPLGEVIAEASEKWFGLASETLSELVDVKRLEAGERAYDRHCVGCHGATGDGAGPAVRHLDPRPRNFRRGVFKFTSTATGEAPLPADIYQTLTRGLSGASMPEFRLLSSETRWDLVEYTRYLAIKGSFEQLMLDIAWDDEELPDGDDLADIIVQRWHPDNVRAVYPPTSEPERTPETVARGRELFVSTDGANCAACHGEGGKGDGASAGDFKDDWGYPIVPRDLTTGVYRAGADSASLYRSISTGVSGTPMPAYAGSITPEDTWALVHFIQSLGGN